ncbi:hypothetical protein CMV30_19015 [Nibricoccus aquaticus]|uniref:Uncharacterized protein n=1 Tax=Nibricoccus aquaticus TaxID=2576891 RepID=A0A290QB24_9BACT|nr:hypothetical protein [Nibricoccus aquaticus]ATC65869.1 hypothetical protein CMV30_19015 [Nibricoccus aquaticus]
MLNLIERFSEKNRVRDTKFFRVKFKRSVMVPDDFGAMTASTVDEVRDVPESVAASAGDAAEILGEVIGGRLIERRRRIDPTIGVPPPLPVPENFKALPSVFADLFTSLEKLRLLKARKDACAAFLKSVSVMDPEHRHYDRKLENVAAELEAFDLDKVAKLQLTVSTLTINATEEANQLRAEVEALAFEMFSLRAHGLGLEKWQLERAFPGSAVHVRYIREKLGLTNLRQAFIGSRMHPYIDLGLTQTAWYYERATAFKAECEKLLAEVKKELAAVKKTFAKELVAA